MVSAGNSGYLIEGACCLVLSELAAVVADRDSIRQNLAASVSREGQMRQMMAEWARDEVGSGDVAPF